MDDIPKIPEHEITPPALYFNRRRFLRGGIAAGSAIATAALYRRFNPTAAIDVVPASCPTEYAEIGRDNLLARGWRVDEPMTPEHSIRSYNNFYEFTTEKEGVAAAAAKFNTNGWKVVVDGLVHKPRSFSIDELQAISRPEERVYRMRCVEAWSMVIPWAGIPFARLGDCGTEEQRQVRRLSDVARSSPDARSKDRRAGMAVCGGAAPGRSDAPFDPFGHRAVREDVTATGRAPVRLVVPWKYGFKGIKSIVRITLAADQPATTWSRTGPTEYGFYANVNPAVDHPRWSQATEQRIGELGRRPTLLFNGYEKQVAQLYAGMDLQANF